MAVFFFDTFQKVTTPYFTAELRLRCIYETKRIKTDHMCNVLHGNVDAEFVFVRTEAAWRCCCIDVDAKVRRQV